MMKMIMIAGLQAVAGTKMKTMMIMKNQVTKMTTTAMTTRMIPIHGAAVVVIVAMAVAAMAAARAGQVPGEVLEV